MNQARPWSFFRLTLVLSLWLAVVGNLPLWRALSGLPELAGVRGALFVVALVLWIGAALVLVFSLLAWPRLFKPAAAALLLTAAASAHFMWQYGVVIDSTMMANVVHTDLREVRDLLSWSLVWSGGMIWRRTCPILERI